MTTRTPHTAPREHSGNGLSRRRWLQLLPGAGGLLLAVGLDGLPRIAQAQEAPKYGADGMPNGWRDSPATFIAIGRDGRVTIVVHRSEMGQGIRTSLPRVVADELEADWARVRVQQAPGDEGKFGNQDTDGSRSMRHWFEPMRRCGAAARQMLEAAAAARWGVPVAEVAAKNHQVVHAASKRSLGFGALAEAAGALPVPERSALTLKTPEHWRYIGKDSMLSVDGADMVSGRAQYGQDVMLPGMLFAVVARPPVLGSAVKRFDAAAALKVPGVLKVIELPGTPPPSEFQPLGGVAVVARDTWSAIEGRKALVIEWTDSPHASYDTSTYRATLQAAANSEDGKLLRNEGDARAALAVATRRVEADYHVPHLAHVSMETPVAVARIVGGRCECWAPVQSPQAARDRIAKRLKLDFGAVTVNVTLLGGGFGRKSKPDFAVEAALLSQALDGAAVKVTWTREDDLAHDYLHTISAQRLEAGINADGKLIAWRHRAAEQTFMSLFMPDPKHLHGIEIGLGLIGLPFDIPNIRIENPAAEAHARIGWLRSVNNIQHAFATQSFVAELAAAAGRDHRDYLLALLGADRKIDPAAIADGWNHGESPERYPIDTGRLRRVIERVTQEAGWGKGQQPRSGRGLAAHYSFVSYVAAVVQVAVDAQGQLRIPRVDVAVDCGAVVNPDRVRSQIEGAVINGLSQAMFGEVTFQNGRVQQRNFQDYELLRMAQAPREIRVHLMPSNPALPLGGVGEPGVPPIAPALCNALFAATGKRIRQLPIGRQLA
ncbi:xanthine dehydrogenase family protein molybdopterin-binding subunit [Aquabacterium sp. OR-4]|uniref:xanthine dehydrogenase family protein molybdopterin-binding subunit n=1 Tax=Aquabacterium sp. OR-4 TaxID=2978127 RepID=UPI0028C8EEBE|nr:molybdopterin cofactor-binding domain-containing protein [Aquabacterium sp. OR-4]MDT7838648.1 molybdopterin cofactor-binding domain-containing protein [Aquabacterium sp. OR-4]